MTRTPTPGRCHARRGRTGRTALSGSGAGRRRTTLFDRYGPDARDIVRAWASASPCSAPPSPRSRSTFAMSTYAISALFGVIAGGGGSG